MSLRVGRERSRSPVKTPDHDDYMRLALKEAEVARHEGEVPVGAVIIHEGRVIGKAHNQRERLRDPTAHAEMIAITQAAASLDRWRLTGATLYVTLEPCPMCAGALVLARIDRLVYGAADPKNGACGSLYDIVTDGRLNHRLEVISGVLEEECRNLLQNFFRGRRSRTD
jgi:tRNA(adenine34) deaminase